MLYMATGKPAHLGCKFLSDVSVVNSPIVVELLVITDLFCVVLPAGRQSSNCLCTEWSPKKSDLQRTRCCVYTTVPPDDEHNIARNM